MTQDKTTKHKIVLAEEFLPELRKKNPEAKWKEAVEYLYDLYGGKENIEVLMHKGESKFLVKI